MKKLFYSLQIFILIFASEAFSQNPMFEYFITVNPANGVHTIIDSIPAIKQIQIGPNCTTIDKANNRYFFKGGSSTTNYSLITLNANNGTVMSKPVLTATMGVFSNVGEFEYDDSLATIIGVGWKFTESAEYLLRINPATASITPIKKIPELKSIILNQSTYDQKRHCYYLTGIDSLNKTRFYAVSALTGNVESSPNIFTSLCSSPRFNSQTGLLYAFETTTANSISLVKIDPPSGITVSTVTNFPGVNGTISFPNYVTIDELNNRLTFKLLSTPNTLVTVDLSTGAIINNPVFPTGLNLGENIVELAYNNITGTLYGLHYGEEQETTVGINELKNESFLTIYPNPVKDHARIEFPQSVKEGELYLFNTSGQLLLKESTYNCNVIYFEKKDLPPGVYSLIIKGDEKFIYNRKLIIE